MKKNLLKSSLITLSLLTLVSCNSTNVHFKKHKSKIDLDTYLLEKSNADAEFKEDILAAKSFQIKSSYAKVVEYEDSYRNTKDTFKYNLKKIDDVTIKYDSSTNAIQILTKSTFTTKNCSEDSLEYRANTNSKEKHNGNFIITMYKEQCVIADVDSKLYYTLNTSTTIKEFALAFFNEAYRDTGDSYDTTLGEGVSIFYNKNVFTIFKSINEYTSSSEESTQHSIEEKTQDVFKRNEYKWVGEFKEIKVNDSTVENTSFSYNLTETYDVTIKIKPITIRPINLDKYTKSTKFYFPQFTI